MASNKERKLKIAIVVLSVLLAASLAALAYLYINFSRPAPAVVTDNVITTSYNETDKVRSAPATNLVLSPRATEVLMMKNETAVTGEPVRVTEEGSLWTSTDVDILKIYKGQDYDLTSFEVGNMFPGDCLYKEYCVQVSHHGAVDVHFLATVRDDERYAKLAEVLQCRIEYKLEDAADYQLLFDDYIKNMSEPVIYTTPDTSADTTTNVTYKISAYLDGPTVGNEYMQKELLADFKWWVEVDQPEETTGSKTDGGGREDDDGGTSGRPTQAETATAPSEPPAPEAGGELVDPPKTGDNTILIFGAALLAGILVILLIVDKRRKEDEHEQ